MARLTADERVKHTARTDDVPPGYDLTRIPLLARWLKHPSWQFQLILPNQILFWVVIVVGFVGVARFEDNFATAITWFVWFSLVFVLILLTGRGWCAVCPFGGLAEWLQRRRLWHRRGRATGQTSGQTSGQTAGQTSGQTARQAGRPVPAWLARHGYVTTALAFGVLTWIEEYYEVADGTPPARTSWTVIGIIALALVSFLAFERRAFCRYLCPLGGLIGVLGAGAPLAGFKAKDRSVCRSCTTKDCLRGNDRAYGCPWFNWPGGTDSAVNCGLCGECFRACPSGNVGLFVEPPLAGLIRARDRRADVAWTAAILAGIMLHQHAHETPVWEAVDTWVNDVTGLPHGPNPLLFVVLAGAFTLLLALPAWIARRTQYRRPPGGLPDRGDSFVYRLTPFRMFFVPLAYAAVPLLACDYLAVEMIGFVSNAPKVIPAAARLVGLGTDGTSSLATAELLSTPGAIRLQVLVLALGTLASAAVAWRIAGTEVAPVARSPRAVQLGGTALMLLAGAITIAVYVMLQGEAG